MSETAQIIVATAILMVALKGIIWVIRCPKDSPNYRLPPVQLPWLREGND
jgi:hypothetical protein